MTEQFNKLLREKIVSAIKNSRSWRITRPLRHMNRRLKKMLGRNPHALVLGPAQKKETHTIFSAPYETSMVFPDLFALTGFTAEANIAIILQIEDEHQGKNILSRLQQLDKPFDLFISLIKGRSDHLADWIAHQIPSAFVRVFPDGVNETMAFLWYVNTGVFNQYEMALKLSSCDLSDLTIDSMLNEKTIKDIVKIRLQGGDVGMIGPSRSIKKRSHQLAEIEAAIADLSQRLDETSSNEDEILSLTGEMFWISPFILRLIQSLRLTQGELAHYFKNSIVLERLLAIFCKSAALKMVELPAGSSQSIEVVPPPKNKINLLAFYLPQFFPTPENDRWWGRGFTEWTFVSQAKPSFDRHRQPKLPTDLGFYDLRLPEARDAQAELAKQYGIGGFCYHYYWFDIGKRILDEPLRAILQSNKPDFPFCVSWANHNWSRRWDGLEQEVLLEQKYSYESCRALIHDLMPLFRDPRYFRFKGKPLFVIFYLLKIPNYQAICEMWREECIKMGVGDIHIAAYDWGLPPELQGRAPDHFGIDAWIDSPPILTKAYYGLSAPLHASRSNLNPSFTGAIYDYGAEVEFDLERYQTTDALMHRHRGLMVGFDNTPRRKENATIYYGSNPAKFRRWLAGIIQQESALRLNEESLIFVQAWNEWAEGNMLEPDQHFGCGYLEAIKSCIKR